MDLVVGFPVAPSPWRAHRTAQAVVREPSLSLSSAQTYVRAWLASDPSPLATGMRALLLLID
jgi:hypothetical protein